MFERLIARLGRAGWREFVLLSTVAGICGSVWIFVAVSDEVLDGDLHDIERRVMLALRAPDNPAKPIGPEWLASAALEITALGGAATVALLAALVIGYFVLARNIAAVSLVTVAVGGGALLSLLLKSIFARERPDIVPHLATVSSPSFPSGHSMASSIVYLTLGACLAQLAARRREKVYFIVAALIISFLVGITRIYLGVHYPSDVLAGWAAGTAWALLCWLTAYWLSERGTTRPSA